MMTIMYSIMTYRCHIIVVMFNKPVIPYIISSWSCGLSIEAGKSASAGSLQKRSTGHSIKPWPSALHKLSISSSQGHVPSSRGCSVKRHLRYIVPWNCWMPRIPNSMKMKSMNTTALRREFTEPTKDETSLRIFGKALIERKGLSTLNVRKARTLNQLSCIISKSPVTTTIRSSQFQMSRK